MYLCSCYCLCLISLLVLSSEGKLPHIFYGVEFVAYYINVES